MQPPVEKKKDQLPSSDAADDADDDNDVYEDDMVGHYNDQLQRIAMELSPEWSVGEWIVLKYMNTMFPGEIMSIREDGKLVVDCMHECFSGRNSFRWPHPRDDKTPYDPSVILCKIAQPEKPTNSRGAAKLLDDDFQKAKDLLLNN